MLDKSQPTPFTPNNTKSNRPQTYLLQQNPPNTKSPQYQKVPQHRLIHSRRPVQLHTILHLIAHHVCRRGTQQPTRCDDARPHNRTAIRVGPPARHGNVAGESGRRGQGESREGTAANAKTVDAKFARVDAPDVVAVYAEGDVAGENAVGSDIRARSRFYAYGLGGAEDAAYEEGEEGGGGVVRGDACELEGVVDWVYCAGERSG